MIARLDPSLFEARLGQAQANLVGRARQRRAARADARGRAQKYERAQAAVHGAAPPADRPGDGAAPTYDERGRPASRRAEAAVTQAAAAVNQAQVDLDHTIIRAPIDGVVIARSVDVGQTVAASLQAPDAVRDRERPHAACR